MVWHNDHMSMYAVKEKVSNIKTYARFRPLNSMELELNQNELGKMIASFPSDKSVVVGSDAVCFSLNKVYMPGSQQQVIYDEIVKETINEVLNGYNGTVFAYGQTGSGKTYTMFGEIHSEAYQGIIPRASYQIINYVNSHVDFDIEFIISCSMLEIYKENLYDLLSVGKTNLKIKESV